MSSQVSTSAYHTPASPTSPAPRSRLRGLSYLLSRDRPSHLLTRSTSYPASPASPNLSTQPFTNELSPSRSQHPESVDSPPTTSEEQTAEPRILTQNSPQQSDAASNTNPSGTLVPMTRARSATVGSVVAAPAESSNAAQGTVTSGDTKAMAHQLPSIRFTAHHAPGANRPSLVFSPLSRILPTGREIIKVGRYSERDNPAPQPANVPSSAPVGFKSKVVSRRHCEFWYSNGRWYIKDVKSSSGTFLNHIRLSSPGTESPPFPINDGDIVQLGIDFKGGEEMIFRCVKIRVELNKGWQNGPNSFNMQSHKRLRELNNIGKPSSGGGSSQDCAICLGAISPCQSLFVAPCSHTWHFKCIRQLINGPMYPHFVCPNCRTVADLEAELDDPFANGNWGEAPVDGSEVVGAENEHSVEPATSTSAERQTNVEPTREAPQEDHSEIEPTSDSDSHPVGVDGRYVAGRHTPSSDSESPPAETSNSTVPAVDIVPRRSTTEARPSTVPLPNISSAVDGSLPQDSSPQRFPAIADGVPEGPMTPRNDLGPFIFDGGAGRVRPLTDLSTANASADEAEDVSKRVRAEAAST